MNNKTIIILSIFIMAIVGLSVILLNKSNDRTVVQDDDTLLYEKSEDWGPCPKSICHQTTKLYYSGILVMDGAKELQKQLDEEAINNLIEKIKLTDVMNKNCSAPIVVDYSATYKLNMDNQEKTIQFPGCEDEFRKIEQFIPTE